MRPLPAVLMLVAFCAAAPSGIEDRHRWEDRVRATGRRYEVETNAFPEIATSLSRSLDQAYVLFEDRFGPLTGRAARRMSVSLFRTKEEYLSLGDGVQGAIGHYDAASDRCILVWRGETGRHGWPIAVHEACHQFQRRRQPHAPCPSWYTEGIACYFEGVTDPLAVRRLSRIRVPAARAAHAAGDADLGLLLSARARVTDGELELTNFQPSRFYALAWSLVHFLATDPRYEKGFRRFELRLFHCRPHPDGREALARRLLEEECGDLSRLEKRWHGHLANLPAANARRSVPVYSWELGSPSAYGRYGALLRLEGAELPPDLRPGVLACLRDPDLIVRTRAVHLMGTRGDPVATGALVEALDAGDAGLKRSALRGLAHAGAAAAVPRLARERELRDEAVDALAVIGDPEGFRTLRGAVVDPAISVHTRARCAVALARDPDAEAVLLVAAQDPDPVVRTSARAALVRRGRPLPEDPAPAPRPAPPAAGPGLEGDQRDEVATLLANAFAPVPDRVIACRRVARARDRSFVPDLRRLCRAGEPERLRLEAVRALVALTGERRGYAPGQPPREREAAYRSWSSDG